MCQDARGTFYTPPQKTGGVDIQVDATTMSDIHAHYCQTLEESVGVVCENFRNAEKEKPKGGGGEGDSVLWIYDGSPFIPTPRPSPLYPGSAFLISG